MRLEVPAIGIVRGVEHEFFQDLMFTSFDAGLSAIELTMNTPDAEKTVYRLKDEVPTGKWLGMGTIRNLDEAKRAKDAGAMFFVTPNLDRSVIRFAVENNIPIISGALTPTEIYTAWSDGADMVKVFPCNAFGPGYFKDLQGPFDDIPLVAVGGVNEKNLMDYFAAGAVAVGVSSALFGKTDFINRDIDAISKNVKRFIKNVNECF